MKYSNIIKLILLLVTILFLKYTFVINNLKLPILNINSYIILYFMNFHEKKLLKKLKKLQLIIGNKCIIDAGAYVGDTSIILAKNNPFQKVYAIEPSIPNFTFIKKVKNLNEISNLIPLNYLLSNQVSFYSSKNTNLSNAYYSKSTETDSNQKSYKLDDLIQRKIINEKVGLLHFDVEGMEEKVLKGSLKTILNDKPIIVIEVLG